MIKRGVEVAVKSIKYKELPESWKKISCGSDNAIFPLIAIDRKIIWYGMPDSDGAFQVKGGSFKTVAPIIARITGKNTMEMIYSLTDLEVRQTGEQKKALHMKDAGSVENSGGKETQNQKGLGVFVSKKQFCPECKSPMQMVRGRSGKTYLKCSNSRCTHTDLLPLDLVNYYIEFHNVDCPKDGGHLKARLGQYGLYIQCECGHFLKPDEI